MDTGKVTLNTDSHSCGRTRLYNFTSEVTASNRHNNNPTTSNVMTWSFVTSA
jgi:hypothetical protein